MPGNCTDTTPGVTDSESAQSRRDESGTLRWKSPLMLTACSASLVSSNGVSALTSTVSVRPPTARATSIGTLTPDRTVTPSRRTLVKPCSSKATA